MTSFIRQHKAAVIISIIAATLLCILVVWTDWHERRMRSQTPIQIRVTAVIDEPTEATIIRISRAAALREAGKQLRMQIERRADNGEIEHPHNEAEAIAILRAQLRAAQDEIAKTRKGGVPVMLTNGK